MSEYGNGYRQAIRDLRYRVQEIEEGFRFPHGDFVTFYDHDNLLQLLFELALDAPEGPEQ